MATHVHRWARCADPVHCRHLFGGPHWVCHRCGDATMNPPGEHLFDHPPGEYEPDWIVLRPGPNLPHTLMPPELDGRWFDRAGLPPGPLSPGAIARTVPTGRFEDRTAPDGTIQIAEVFEIEPVMPEGD